MEQVSVVIPTLGDEKVAQTIRVLNSGSLVPQEIILCVPEGTVLKFPLPDNTRILFCKKRAQVAQRAMAFAHVKSEFVLQLDDDTYLDKGCLQSLVDASKELGPKCAIAPVILDSDTNESFYKNAAIKSKLHLFLINGKRMYRPGTVTLVGSSFGPVYQIGKTVRENVEWVAGCCVLHRKENLILEDYFVLKGKAYGEDLLASYLYSQKGIKFYIDSSAICRTPGTPENSITFKELIKDLKSKDYYLTLSKRSKLHFYLYAIIKIGTEILVKPLVKAIK